MSESEREKHLVRIQMEQSREFLNAASVTAVGNPVMIKKDTVVFNANAYRIVENAMLADLLKKMPGFKIGAEFIEDIRRNVMGGYFLVGLILNFG